MQIKIHKDLWDIELVDSRDEKMNPNCQYQYMGLCEYKKLLISISDGLPETVARAVVIHELTHAFMESFGHSVMDDEGVCNFFGAHGDEIIQYADKIMRKVITNADHI